jgi:hypothetical protein
MDAAELVSVAEVSAPAEQQSALTALPPLHLVLVLDPGAGSGWLEGGRGGVEAAMEIVEASVFLREH